MHDITIVITYITKIVTYKTSTHFRVWVLNTEHQISYPRT